MSENTESTPVSETKKPRAVKDKYKALVGLSYGEKVIDAGDVVDDIPKESLSWLLEGNYIKKVS